MQVMIVDEDAGLRTAMAAAFAPLGCDVLSFGRLEPARVAARERSLDLLVVAERVGGRLAHDLALAAEWRNPLVGSVMLTDRDDAGELFELLPSLRAVLGRGVDAGALARVALGAAGDEGETAEQRLARRWAEAGGDAGGDADDEGAPEPDAPVARLPSFLARGARPVAPERQPDPIPAFASRRRAAGGRRLHLG